MVTEIIFREKIRAHVLKVLSGYCFRERHSNYPSMHILSPWISDVQLDIDSYVYKLDELWFGLDYGIESINLCYALLLLRLQFGARLDIVTLPPNEKNYGDNVTFHRSVLDFLDEIGCFVYVNEDLHSKLILSNDLALIGSFNLSKSALYDREEIGISVDDISNLKILDEYARSVVNSSIPYGYTPLCDQQRTHEKLVSAKITRGWLYEEIVKQHFDEIIPNFSSYDQFLKDDIGTKSWYLDRVVSEVASDIEGFYVRAVLTYLGSSHRNKEVKLSYLKNALGYQGEYKVEDIVAFLKGKLARAHFPKIFLRMKSMQKMKAKE